MVNGASSARWTVAVWLSAAVAAGQVPPQKMAADAAFDQGKALMASGDLGAACARFAESQRLDPASSTLLWLGECLEKSGKLASAWSTYREAAALSAQQGKAAREKDARDRVAAIEPRVPQIALRGELSTPGLELQLDGVALGAALWQAPLPLDAGEHTLLASAPGRAPRTVALRVTPDRGPQPVDVPALASAPAPAVSPAPVASSAPAVSPTAAASPGPVAERGPTRPSSRLASTGLLVGGIGAVAVLGGVVLQLAARSKADDSRERHDLDLYDAARTQQTVAISTLVVGGALVTAGAVLLFYPIGGSTTAVRLTPGGVQLGGRF